LLDALVLADEAAKLIADGLGAQFLRAVRQQLRWIAHGVDWERDDAAEQSCRCEFHSGGGR
jgi:hypothetical protein